MSVNLHTIVHELVILKQSRVAGIIRILLKVDAGTKTFCEVLLLPTLWGLDVNF